MFRRVEYDFLSRLRVDELELTFVFIFYSQRWNLISSLPPPPASAASSIRVSEEERKRIEQEQRLIRPERDKIAPLATFSPYGPHVQVRIVISFSVCVA